VASITPYPSATLTPSPTRGKGKINRPLEIPIRIHHIVIMTDQPVKKIKLASMTGDAADITWEESVGDLTGKPGVEIIGEFVKHLPNAPGCYRMFDAQGEVLYVGKAKSYARSSTYCCVMTKAFLTL